MDEATTPHERLRDELRVARSAAAEATLAAALIRPDPPAEGVREGLKRVREALDTAAQTAAQLLAAAAAGRRHGDAEDGRDHVDRRGLLRTFAAAAATAAVPSGAVGRVAEISEMLRGARVDAALLERFEAVAAQLASAFYRQRPEALTAPVRALADAMSRALADGSMAPGQRRRLGALSADMALCAGQNALDLDARADATAWFGLGRDLAREAADATLHSLAVDALGRLHILRTPEGRPGDAQRAVWHTRQALGGLPADAPGYVRAWLAVDLACHQATVGDDYGFHAAMEQAAQAAETSHSGRPMTGFMSDAGWLEPVLEANYLADYEGRGLALLGRLDAEPVLRDALGSDAGPRRRVAMLVSLARTYAGADEPDQAAAVAVEAADLANRAGYAVAFDALCEIRALLPGELPAVADLDERLAATAGTSSA